MVKIPANKGWKRISKLQALTNENPKNKRLIGEKTADWKFAKCGAPEKLRGFQSGIIPSLS